MGQTSQWTGAGADDNWFTAGNWDNGIPNLTTSVALVDAPAPTILNTSTIIQSLMIGANGSLDISPLRTLTLLNSGAPLTNHGSLTLQTRTRLSLTGTLSSSGQITLNFSSASDDTAVFVNTGGLTIDGGGVITLDGTAARIRGVVGEVLTIANHTIEGRGVLGFGELKINVSSTGLVDANFSGAALTFQPGVQPAQNLGTLKGSSGGILVLNGSGGGQINNTGGLIVAEAGSEVQFSNGILLSGGTLTTVGDGVLRPVGSINAIFENLTINGSVVTGSRGDITLRGTINSTGTITINPGNATSDTLLEIEASGATLTGGGVITLAGGSSITGAAGGTLTVADQTIEGSDDFGRNLINVVVNSGNLVDANEAGREMILDPHPSGGFVNQGTIQASDGGFLRLTGNGGGVFQNTGGVIIARAGSEVITRDGAHIIGGILRTQGTGLIRTVGSENSIFEDLSIQGDMTTASRGDITLRGVIDNQGTITINPGNATSGTLLEIEASGATLTGGGQIVMNGQTSTRITGDAAGVLTLANQDVSGRGQLGSNVIGIVNQSESLIHANVAASALVLDVGASGFSNSGTLRASNGATLAIADSFVNQGLIDAATNSLVDVNATLTNGISGTITGNGRVESNGGLSNLGEIAPAGVLTLDLNTGSLLLETTSLLSIELASNTQFDQLLVTDGRTVLGGTLEISLLENFLPSASDVFTFLTSPFAATSFGQFANVGQNGTIMTQDGSGIFTVTYFEVIAAGSDRVQLSNFQIVPEPSTACLALAGLIGIISRRRRDPAR